MNIQLSVYEVFSRIIPGMVYLAAVGQLSVIAGLVKLDFQTLNDLSFFSTLCLITVAYILGAALDRLSLTWFRIFQKRGYSARTFTEFKNRHEDHWNIGFEDKDLSTLLAIIRTKNLELISDLDRQNALSVMLRNVSLGTLLLMINQIILFLISKNPNTLMIGATLFILSMLLVQDSVRYRGWYYSAIYENVLAFRIDLKEAIKPVASSVGENGKKTATGKHETD